MSFVPRPVLTYAIGVVGHRPPRLDQSAQIFVEARLKRVFEAIDRTLEKEYEHSKWAFTRPSGSGEPAHTHRVRLLTGFAEGSDTIAALAAPPHWEVEAILPAKVADYAVDFSPRWSSDGTDRAAAFHNALARAGSRVVELPTESKRSDRAPEVRGTTDPDPTSPESHARQAALVLRQVDLLVAVWDGGETSRAGDTAATVVDALANSIPVVWLSSTEDRAPWLLARPEDIDREAEPADALDGPLHDAIVAAVRPPSAADQAGHGGEPGVGLEAFLDERRQVRCGWFYYDALKTGWKFWNWRVTGIPLATLDATKAKWEVFLEEASPAGDFAERVRHILLPRFHAADQIATYYAHAYRSAYVLAYLLATLAVAVTTVSTLPYFPHEGAGAFHAKAAFVAVELGLIGFVIYVVRRGRRGHWHERWLTTRALAEQLRHLRFLTLMGGPLPARPIDDFTPYRGAWASWYLRSTSRELGLPFCDLGRSYQRRALIATRKTEVTEQIDFNERNSEALENLNHRLHFWGDLFFYTVTAILLSYFLTWIIAAAALPLPVSEHGGGHETVCDVAHPMWCLLHAVKPWLVIVAALLPAMGAATAGVRFTGDFEGFAERSGRTLERLRGLSSQYERAEERLAFDSTMETFALTAEAMRDDLSGWTELYARKRLSLPA